MKPVSLVIYAFFAALLAAGPILGGEKKKKEEIPPERGVYQLRNIPFEPATSPHGAEASLRSVLHFLHNRESAADVEPSSFTEPVSASNIVESARKNGFTAHSYSGSLNNLRLCILAGFPPVVLLPDKAEQPSHGQYAVVTGFDDDREGVYINVGDSENKFVTYNEFVNLWQEKKFWTLQVSTEDN